MWPLSNDAVALAAIGGLATGTLALLIALWTRWSLARDRKQRGENQLPWAEMKLVPLPELGWFAGRIEFHNPSGRSIAIEELRVEKPGFMRLAAVPEGAPGPRTAAIAGANPSRSLPVSWVINEPHAAHSDLAFSGEVLVQCAPSMIRRWTSAKPIRCRVIAHGRYRTAKARRVAIPAPGLVKI